MRRFARPYKGFAKQRPGRAKCGGEKPHKGAKPRLRFFVARAANGGEAHTVLLGAVIFASIVFLIFFYIYPMHNYLYSFNSP
jgi:hypothetical protein